MSRSSMGRKSITTLLDFYRLMAETREVRAKAVRDVFADFDPSPETTASLSGALDSLEAIPENKGLARLALDEHGEIDLDLSYEIGELKKDILYLASGEEALLSRMAELHEGFEQTVKDGAAALSGLSFNCFISDRDGTTNNYCGRYNSSIQSIYNAVFLTRFAAARVEHPVFITSAPLMRPGIVDVSVNPEGAFVYGASKGREYMDLENNHGKFEVPADKQDLLDRLNDRLRELLDRPEYVKFTLIGSGLQFKFGQSTIARQDITNSIAEEDSLSLLERIHGLVEELDPDGEHFRIEDTGLDVEIILTIEGEGGLKDFDKGDAVKYLNEELSLDMERGPHLVCGDTPSDIPMITAARGLSDDVRSIFVTQKEDVAARVLDACPGAVVVSEPDMLVAILNNLAAQD